MRSKFQDTLRGKDNRLVFSRCIAPIGLLLLASCATLLNSDRPRYHGRIVQPAWHDAGMKVEQTPVIHDGVVYAVARPYADPDWPRVYAFDLKTGKSLWIADFEARQILLAAGSRLFVASNGAGIYSLDTKTGKESADPDAITFSQAILQDGVLYSTGGNIVEAWPLKSLPVRAAFGSDKIPPLWIAFIPSLTRTGLSVASGTVYLNGFTRSDVLTGKRASNLVSAFDAATGALRWKWEVPGKGDSFMLYGVAADGDAAYLWIHDLTQDTFGQGVLLALDASTGAEKWRRTTSLWVPFWDAPLLCSPKAVVIPDYPPGKEGTANNTGFVYRALDRATGETLWESQTAWKYPKPVAFEGRLYVSDQKVHELLTENNNVSPDSWVTAVDLRTGKELWRSPTVELGVFTQPAAGEGMVVVGSQPFHWESPARAGKREAGGLWAWRLSE